MNQSTNHRTLSAPHSNFVQFLDHFIDTGSITGFVTVEQFFKQRLRIWMSGQQGTLQDVQIYTFVFGNIVLMAQSKVNENKIHLFSWFLQ